MSCKASSRRQITKFRHDRRFFYPEISGILPMTSLYPKGQ